MGLYELESCIPVAYKSSSARFDEKTKSTEGNLKMHSTREIGKQLKRKMDGCIRKYTITSTGKDAYAYWLGVTSEAPSSSIFVDSAIKKYWKH